MNRAVATGDAPLNLDNRIRSVEGLGREHGNSGQAGDALGRTRSHLREAPPTRRRESSCKPWHDPRGRPPSGFPMT